MSYYMYSFGQDAEFERQADALLRAANALKPGQCKTERSIMDRRMVRIPVDSLAELSCAPSQTFRDELRFLVTVTRLAKEIRDCLILWVDGFTQTEIARKLSMSQASVSNKLKLGLRRCYDATPVTFRNFSRHSIYRKPGRHCASSRVRKCLRCKEVFNLASRAGRYCSEGCREAAKHRRSARFRFD